MGVGFIEDSTEESSGERYPGTWRRPWAAISAASESEIAEGFFLAVLNANLDRGATAARVSVSLSWSALIA